MILALLLGIPFIWWVVILSAIFIIDVACFAYESYGWSVTIMTLTIAGAFWIDHHSTSPLLTANLHRLFVYYVPAYLIAGFGTALIKWILYAAKRVRWIKEAKSQFDNKEFKPKEADFKHAAEEQAYAEAAEERKKIGSGFSGFDPRGTAKYEARVQTLATQYENEFTASIPTLRRRAFVEFYKDGMQRGTFDEGKRGRDQIYTVDYSKETAVVDALTPRAKDNVGKLTIWVYQWPVVIVSSLIEEFLLKAIKHFATALDALFSKVVRGMVAKATKGL